MEQNSHSECHLGIQENEDIRSVFDYIVGSLKQVFWIREGGRFTYVSPLYESVWKRGRGPLYSNASEWLDALHDQDKEKYAAQVEGLKEGVSCDMEYRILVDEDYRWVRDRFFVVSVNADGLSKIAGVSEDITDKKNIEHQLNQSQKLESIGSLAAGVAHEINTPIQYIGNNLQFMSEEVENLFLSIKRISKMSAEGKVSGESINKELEDLDFDYLLEEMPRAIDQSIEGTRQVSRIVQSMKAFAHPDQADMACVNVNDLVSDVINVSRNEWKYLSTIETLFDPAIPSIMCHPGKISQVVLNMIVNAVHAIEAKVDVRNDEKGLIEIETKMLDGFVELIISDDGCGIPDEIQGRVYDQFFTTKAIGKGTGQGLAMVRQTIVDEHQGKISFETKAGKGTTFRILLPLCNEQE